jgi:hypothetical protein
MSRDKKQDIDDGASYSGEKEEDGHGYSIEEARMDCLV